MLLLYIVRSEDGANDLLQRIWSSQGAANATVRCTKVEGSYCCKLPKTIGRVIGLFL